jgi:glycosyltransferase involved in cell wall biosynthesis
VKLHFYSPNRIEPWDYRNVFDVGIGGSETSHVEMAMRLAARGHQVTSYTDLPADCPDRRFGGVVWKHLDEADLEEDGLWIIYRQPSFGFKCKPTTRRRYWLVCQDVYYPDWDTRAVGVFDRIIGLCPRHCDEIEHRDQDNANRVYMSSNGINVERIIESEITSSPVRSPNRLIWASSPDRGLKETLDIFERAREEVPDLELHIFYGMDNIDKICGGDRKKMPWKQSWQQYDRACSMPGVTWRGRIGQRQLTQEWLSSGIWLYPTWFSETSCIACMEAQACGAIPITNPIWATGYNVKNGVFVEGQPGDPLVKARYVDAVVRVASNVEAQEHMRWQMMGDARRRFSWEVWVSQWETWMSQPVQELRWNSGRLTCAEEVAACC